MSWMLGLVVWSEDARFRFVDMPTVPLEQWVDIDCWVDGSLQWYNSSS